MFRLVMKFSPCQKKLDVNCSKTVENRIRVSTSKIIFISDGLKKEELKFDQILLRLIFKLLIRMGEFNFVPH